MAFLELLRKVLTVRESHGTMDAPQTRLGIDKVKCEQCGKFVGGLRQHRKAVHGSAARAKPDPWGEDNETWFEDPDMGAR